MNEGVVGSEERVAWVDERDEVKCAVPRSAIRAGNLLHRAVYVLVWDLQQRIFVHQRSFNKDLYPGLWDLCITGVPRVVESYEDAARRELREEIGIADARLVELFAIRFQDSHTNVIGRVYFCLTSLSPVVQESEIIEGHFVKRDALPAWFAAREFCPDGLHVWEQFTRVCG